MPGVYHVLTKRWEFHDDRLQVHHSFYVDFDPNHPRYVSTTDDGTSIRLAARENSFKELAVVIPGVGRYEMKIQSVCCDREVWRAVVPRQPPFEYYIEGTDKLGRKIEFHYAQWQKLIPYKGSKYTPVGWVPGRVTYQIFPERFNNGNPENDWYPRKYDNSNYIKSAYWKPLISDWNDEPSHEPLMNCCHQYFGGDIKGITEKLDYLKELGVGIIYITPPFLCGTAHGYDPYDFYTLNPHFGTEEEFKEFLDEAHKRNIKVIFDITTNHVGVGNPMFQDVVKNGPNSRYWDWFFIKKWPFEPGDASAYETWWGVPELVKLNMYNPEVQDYLINAIIHWIDFGFDGVRLDTPRDIWNKEEVFQKLYSRLKEKHPDAYVVGEVWELCADDWLMGDKVDAIMNYEIGLNIIAPFFRGDIDGQKVFERLSWYFWQFPDAAIWTTFNMIDSHDVPRIWAHLNGFDPVERIEGELLEIIRAALAWLVAMPGTPVVYMGDERGITDCDFANDAWRNPIRWDEINKDVFEMYREVLRLKKHDALKSPYSWVVDAGEDWFAFARGMDMEYLVIVCREDCDNVIGDRFAKTWGEVVYKGKFVRILKKTV